MNWTKIQPPLKIEPSILFGILNHCRYLLQSNPLTKKSAATVCIYAVSLSETCGTCPSTVLFSSQQALFKCHRDVSHLCRLYVDSGPRQCSEVSSLITMSSLVWSSVTKAPFTGAACLLSSISLEFHCSGWEAPEPWRQTWSQWRNMVLPSSSS